MCCDNINQTAELSRTTSVASYHYCVAPNGVLVSNVLLILIIICTTCIVSGHTVLMLE